MFTCTDKTIPVRLSPADLENLRILRLKANRPVPAEDQTQEEQELEVPEPARPASRAAQKSERTRP